MKQARYNILIFGPQGSGKGTQAKMLSKLLHIPHISPGAMYREIQHEDSERGKIVRERLNKGILIPDEITNAMMRERLQQEDCKHGFILDGYPRNKAQADALKTYAIVDYLILINLPDKISIKRIAGRRECPKGHTYHIEYDPPKKAGICDIEGLSLAQRQDESEEALQRRLTTYHHETKPLIEEYHKQGVILIAIDGSPAIEEVSHAIKTQLGL